MTAKQLTDSILQMAIQGKLVPQDPNDEPASVLLERIREKKRRLVREGKLKKSVLNDTPIEESEIPFNIPKGWVWCRLKSIFNMQAGKNVTSANIKDLQSDEFPYPCYGGNGLRGYVKGFNTDGDFPLIGRQGALCGNVNMAKGKFWATEHAVVTDGFEMTDVRWQYYFLRGLNLNKYATATAQPGLAVSKIIETLIPLPPLAEQKRIVKRVESFMPEIKELFEAYDEASKMDAELPDKLKKSILQEAIMGKLGTQDPNDEPAKCLLEDIRAEKQKLVEDKILKKKDLEEIAVEEDEIPQQIIEGWEYVKLPFVTSLIDGTKREGEFVCLDAKFLRGKSAGEKLSKGKFVHQNDNIILVDGENSGEVFTVPCDGYMGSTFKQLWVTGVLYLPYVLYFIKANKDLLRNSKKGAAIPHLNKDVFYNLVIGIPPLAEQHRIVHKIEELYAEIDNMTVENNININEIEVTDNE